LLKSQELEVEVIKECAVITEAYNDLIKTWTLPVVHALGLKEPVRFNKLKRRIAGISATSLAERLNELEKREIVERKVYPETPPRVEYSFTKRAKSSTQFSRSLQLGYSGGRNKSSSS